MPAAPPAPQRRADDLSDFPKPPGTDSLAPGERRPLPAGHNLLSPNPRGKGHEARGAGPAPAAPGHSLTRRSATEGPQPMLQRPAHGPPRLHGDSPHAFRYSAMTVAVGFLTCSHALGSTAPPALWTVTVGTGTSASRQSGQTGSGVRPKPGLNQTFTVPREAQAPLPEDRGAPLPPPEVGASCRLQQFWNEKGLCYGWWLSRLHSKPRYQKTEKKEPGYVSRPDPERGKAYLPRSKLPISAAGKATTSDS